MNQSINECYPFQFQSNPLIPATLTAWLPSRLSDQLIVHVQSCHYITYHSTTQINTHHYNSHFQVNLGQITVV